MADNSAFTHLATGRLIIEDWSVPTRDPFSFTARGEPWTVYSWLASTGMALADKGLGPNGIQLARVALTCALAAVAWRLTRPAGALAGRILAVAVVLVVGTGAWTERPLLVALLLMGLLVLAAEREGGPRWPIAVVMWAWVNVHGSWPLGLVYLVVRLLGRRIDGSPPAHLGQVLAAAGIGTLAGGVNPLGPRLLVFPIELLGRHDLLERVVEWRSPNFSRPTNLVLLGGVLLALVLAGRRRSWEDTLVVLVFGAAACIAVRNEPIATLAITPSLARGLAGLGNIKGERRSPATAMAAVLLGVTGLAMTLSGLEDPPYDLEKYPVAAVRWMESEGLFERRVATEDFVGNYLVARHGENANVFFDDRFDMYPRPVIRDAIALLDGKEGWQERLDRYGVEVVLWQRSRPLAPLLSLDPGWEVVHRDDRWLVAVRG